MAIDAYNLSMTYHQRIEFGSHSGRYFFIPIADKFLVIGLFRVIYDRPFLTQTM